MEKYIHKIKLTDTCWLWQGSIGLGGYGILSQYSSDHRKSLPKRAHRVIYEIARGPIPKGLVLDHLCRVRHCVNPDHLEPVTEKVNLQRGYGPSGLNFRKTFCLRGHHFTSENTYVSPKGGRRCKACRKMQRDQRTIQERMARLGRR